MSADVGSVSGCGRDGCEEPGGVVVGESGDGVAEADGGAGGEIDRTDAGWVVQVTINSLVR